MKISTFITFIFLANSFQAISIAKAPLKGVKSGASEQKHIAHVAKIKSFSCSSSQLWRGGTGMFLEKGGEVFILTSDHVIFHGGEEHTICHVAIDNDRREYSLDLIAVNFLRGLALLRVQGRPRVRPLSWRKFREAGDFRTEATDSVEVYGVPVASDSINVNKGVVLNSGSIRHLLPLIDRMVEIMIHSEYGMSGGPLFNVRSGKFVGMLSHQYIRINYGRPSAISTYGKNDSSYNNLVALAIPSRPIIQWMDQIFQGNFDGDIRLSVKEQLVDNHSFNAEGVRFTRECKTNSTSGEIGGIISYDGSGDGAGIGGSTDNVKNNDCFISVVKSEEGDARYIWPLSKRIWFKKAKKYLSGHKSIRIKSVRLKNKTIKVGHSLLHFFTLLEQGGIPNARIGSVSGVKNNGLYKVVGKLKDGLAALKNQIGTRRSDYADNVDYVNFIEMSEDLLAKVESDLIELIELKKLDIIINSRIWDDLFVMSEINYMTVVNLKSYFYRLRAKLKKLLPS